MINRNNDQTFCSRNDLKLRIADFFVFSEKKFVEWIYVKLRDEESFDLFVCMNLALCISRTTPTYGTVFGVLLASFLASLATSTSRLFGSSDKYLFQGHKDALPVRESNLESATF